MLKRLFKKVLICSYSIVSVFAVGNFISNALANSELKEVWTFESDCAIKSSPAVRHRVVVVSDDSGAIYGLIMNTGKQIWNFQANSEISSPVISGDRVYFGSNSPDNCIYCLDLFTGKYIWSYKTKGGIVSSVAVYRGNAYAGSLDGRLYCCNAETGKRRWSFSSESGIVSSPAIRNGYVYFGNNMTHYFYCLNAENGDEIWRYDIENAVLSSPLTLKNQTIVANLAGKLFKFENNIQEMFYEIGSLQSSSPVFFFDSIYLSSLNNKVYRIDMDPFSESNMWNDNTDNALIASPVIAQNKLYIGNKNNNLYCLNYLDLSEENVFQVNGPIESTVAIVGNKIFLGTMARKLYCLEEKYIESDSTENWPMFRHDPLNTGDSTYQNEGTGIRRIQIRNENQLKRYRFQLIEDGIDNPILILDNVQYSLSDPDSSQLTGLLGNSVELDPNDSTMVVFIKHENKEYSATVIHAEQMEFENNDIITEANEFNPDTFCSGQLITGDADYFHFTKLSNSIAEISFFPQMTAPGVHMEIHDRQDNLILSHDASQGNFQFALPGGDYYLKIFFSDDISVEDLSYYIKYTLQNDDQHVFLTIVNKGPGSVSINNKDSISGTFQQSFNKETEIDILGVPNSSEYMFLKWSNDGNDWHINPASVVVSTHSLIYAHFVEKDSQPYSYTRVLGGIFEGRVNEYLYDSQINKRKRTRVTDINMSDFPIGGHIGIAFDDFDQDGDSDLIYLTKNEDELSKIYYFANEGSPKIPAWKEEFNDAAEYTFIEPNPAIMDFNNDGLKDLFVEDQGKIYYYEQKEKYSFKMIYNINEDIQQYYPLNAIDISLVDIDADKDLDLLVYGTINNWRQLYAYEYQHPDFQFDFPSNYSKNVLEFDIFKKIYAISFADMNHDDEPDLLMAAYGGIYLILKDGIQWKSEKKIIDLPTDISSMDFAVVDIDNDNDLDIFYTISDQGLFFYENIDSILEINPILSSVENFEPIQYTCSSNSTPITWTMPSCQSNGTIDSQTGLYASGGEKPTIFFDWTNVAATIEANAQLITTINIEYDYTPTSNMYIYVEIQHKKTTHLTASISSPHHLSTTFLKNEGGKKIRNKFDISSIFTGKNIRGQWKLIINNEGINKGSLNHWAILIGDQERVMDVIKAQDATGNVNHAYVNIIHKYDISKSGNVVIIAGKKDDDSISKGVRYLSSFAYQTFRYLGFSDDNIVVFSPYQDSFVDYVDQELETIERSFQELSTENLIVYIVSHGSSHDNDNYFYLKPNIKMTGKELNDLLDDCQNRYQEKYQRNSYATVIIDTCESKAIMEDILSSKYSRNVIVSSVNSHSWITGEGRISFSSYFFSSLYTNQNVQEAFDYASGGMNSLFHQPGDIAISHTHPIGTRVIGADRPVILSGPETTSLTENNFTVEAEIYSHYPIQKTWFEVRDISNNLFREHQLLEYQNANKWSASYIFPQKEKTYEVTIISKDVWNNQSIPYSFWIKMDVDEKLIIITSVSESVEFSNIANNLQNIAEIKGFNKEKDIKWISGTKENIDDALNSWAKDADKLVLCMIGYETLENGVQGLLLNESESLSASELKEMLDSYQESSDENSKRVMIVSEIITQGETEPDTFFHDELIREIDNDSISRSIISNRSECIAYTNLFFINLLFTGIIQDKTFEKAYDDVMPKIGSLSNCITRESHHFEKSKGAQNENFSFGVSPSGDNSPVKQTFPEPDEIYNQFEEIIIGAEVYSDSYTLISSGYAFIEKPDNSFTKETLSWNKYEMRYETKYRLWEQGTYTVEIYFILSNGIHSEPKIFKFESNFNEEKIEEYEPNDDQEHASVIFPGKFPQIHSFYKQDDVDWLKFWINADTAYTISIVDLSYSSNAKLTGEIAPECGEQTKKQKKSESLEYNYPCSGMFYFKIENDSDSYGQDIRYKVTVNIDLSDITGWADGYVFDCCGKTLANGYLVFGENSTYVLNSDGHFILGSPSAGDIIINIYSQAWNYLGSQAININPLNITYENLYIQKLFNTDCAQEQYLSEFIIILQLLNDFTDNNDSSCELREECTCMSTAIYLLQSIMGKK